MNKTCMNKILYNVMLRMPEEVFFNFIHEYISENYSEEKQIQAGSIIEDFKKLLSKEIF